MRYGIDSFFSVADSEGIGAGNYRIRFMSVSIDYELSRLLQVALPFKLLPPLPSVAAQPRL